MTDINEELMDKLTKVCICKVVNRATMKKVIKEGANTLERVQKATGAGAGSGSCGGTRCTPKILELLEAK
jgi:NAD(P)H-nitrite reductase large subunit